MRSRRITHTLNVLGLGIGLLGTAGLFSHVSYAEAPLSKTQKLQKKVEDLKAKGVYGLQTVKDGLKNRKDSLTKGKTFSKVAAEEREKSRKETYKDTKNTVTQTLKRKAELDAAEKENLKNIKNQKKEDAKKRKSSWLHCKSSRSFEKSREV